MSESSLLPPSDAGDAREIPTEPGLGVLPREVVLLRTENARLRRERDEARQALQDSVPPADELGDSEPPPTRPSDRVRRAQKARAAALFTGKWALLLPVIVLLARYAQKRWPEFAELIDGAVQALPQ